jgi:UDP-2-acetamido-3-amino-2,3-dideoxy-glucuronate N-acetyltransferase
MRVKSTGSNKIIGLAGLGYWGKNIFRNLYEMGALHTACDTAPSTLADFRKSHPGSDYTTSFSDLINNAEIKAIALCTPAVSHYDLVRRSLEAGKDVFVEKPLALAVHEGEELVKIAEAGGRVLMVGHILQYHPVVKKLKEIIAAGELGKIQYIYSNRLNIGKLRTEENILWSFAPHDISVILGLLGREPTSVTAMGGDYLNRGVADTTMTLMEFTNGVKGHIFVSWLHPYKEQKLIVVGSNAMAVFDDVSTEKLFIYPHKIEWRNGKVPVAQKADYYLVPVDQGEPLRMELNHFVDCVKNRSKPLTDGNEGIRVLKELDAAQRS